MRRNNGSHTATNQPHHPLPPTAPQSILNKGNSSSPSSNAGTNKPSILHARSKSVNSIAIPEHDVVPDSSTAASHCSMTALHTTTGPTQRIQYYASGSTELATETPVTLTRLEARQRLTKNSTRLVIALVGLPARGKSFVGRKLLHYLNWTGCKCQIFNVGRYRREAYAMLQQEQQQERERERSEAAEAEAALAAAADPDGSSSSSTANANNGSCDANFFDASNQQASELREKVAEMALLDMLRWLDEEDDDDNTTANPHHHNHQSTSNLSESGSTAAGGGGATAANLDSTRHSTSSLGAPPKFSWKRYERVAIFDATNSTDKRRRWILEMCTAPERRKGKPTGVVFVESLCDDKELLDENYRYKVSVSPDYHGVPEEEALTDLRERVRKYEEQYETIADDSMSYIKVFNLSTKLLCNHIYGRMAKELVPALMAWHIGTRPVFLCRPGQTLSGIYTDGEDYVSRAKIDIKDPRFLDMSTNTRKKSFRGDSLGPTGKLFKHALLDLCYEEAHSFMFKRASVRDMAYTGTSLTGLAPLESIVPSFESLDSQHDHREPFPLRIMTSTMPRAIDTVNWEEFDFHIHQVSNLNPLDKGDFAGMELEDIRKVNPAWYHKLEQDPFDTRFPGGESYRDLIRRLGSVVIEVEQQVIPTLVVSHVSILQVLIAYFRNSRIESCMNIEVPLHTVIKFTPVRGGGWMEERIPLTGESPVVGGGVGGSSSSVGSIGGVGVGVGGGGGCVGNSSISNTNSKVGTTTLVPVQSNSEISALGMEEAPMSPIWGDHCSSRSRMYSLEHVRGFPASPTYT